VPPPIAGAAIPVGVSMFDANLEIFLVLSPSISGSIELFAFPNAKFDICFVIFEYFGNILVSLAYAMVGYSSVQFIPLSFVKVNGFY